jgi:hypothetical protein
MPMEQGNEKQSGRMVCPETIELIYMSPSGPGKDQATTSTEVVIQTPQGQIGHVALLFIARPRLRRSLCPPDASPVIPPRIRRYRSFSAHPDPVSTCRASGLGFVAQPSNPMVLW